MSSLRIAVIDDNPADACFLRQTLEEAASFSAQVVHIPIPSNIEYVLAESQYDCVFLDYVLGGENGLDLLRRIRTSGCDVPIIAWSAHGSEAVAVEAMQLGAQDYLAEYAMTPQSVELAVTRAIESVRLSRELGSALRELRQFSGVVAHDVSSPLATILVTAQALAKRLAVGEDAKNVACVESIMAVSRRLHTLIRSLLQYTELEKPDLDEGEANLDDVVSAVRMNLRSAIEASDAELTADPLPCVSGGAPQFIQLFQNLVANSLKYRAPATAPRIHIGCFESETEWQISVTDNGIGIERSALEDAFKPYHRIADQGDCDGLGLGLAICKRIVERRGGRIWAESTVGQGTTFTIVLSKPIPPIDEETPTFREERPSVAVGLDAFSSHLYGSPMTAMLGVAGVP